MADHHPKLERYEIEVLIDWHEEQERQNSEKGWYMDAHSHQQRAKELKEQLAAAIKASGEPK